MAKSTQEKAQELQQLKVQIAALTLKAKMLQQDIVADLFSGDIGTHHELFPDGSKLTYKCYQTYSVKGSDEAIDKALAQLPETIADELITWKPNLVKKVYDGLSSQQAHYLVSIIEIKDGSPSIEYSQAAA